MKKTSFVTFLSSQGVLIALALLILFGWSRYDNFLGLFNITSVLRYNSMFALVSLGMCFVIMTGGIDLSVGATAALGSVVSAILSPHGTLIGTLGGVGAGLIIGLIQALSAYWFGPIYKDVVVYGLFVALLWFRPQGLLGKA